MNGMDVFTTGTSNEVVRIKKVLNREDPLINHWYPHAHKWISSNSTTTYTSLVEDPEGVECVKRAWDYDIGELWDYTVETEYPMGDREMWCFKANYNDLDHQINFRVRRDHWQDQQEAFRIAEHYADVLGKIPKALRLDHEITNISDRHGRASAGTTEVNIPHKTYYNNTFLEEVLIHEGAHITIQDHLEGTPEWLAAVEKDDKFVTRYATTHVNEDLAESYMAWFAVRYADYRDYQISA